MIVNKTTISAYFNRIGQLSENAQVSSKISKIKQLSDALEWAICETRAAHGRGNKIIFIGNGGSAAIASHMATDFTKNGNLRSIAFNDSATLTCLSNDLGYENVFEKQVEMHGVSGDLMFAISSSGQSQNIINAVNQARTKEMKIFTLSGFSPHNKLRKLGHVNVYLPEGEYGFVEIGHLAVCHAILDFSMGWDSKSE